MSRLFVVRLVAVQLLLFLLNELVVIYVGTPVYGVVRFAGIPILSIVVIIAGVVALSRAKGNAWAQATAAGAILATLLVWAFQWFCPGALFGWFIERMR